MSAKPEILILADLPDFLLQPLKALFVCHDYFHTEEKEDLLQKAGTHIRGIAMFGASALPLELLDRLPALEIISVFGVGYDGVPVEACRQRGIRLTNTPDVLTDDVADIATALVLMTSRRLGQAERFLKEGRWAAEGAFPLTHALKGKRAGILGLGRIGKAIAERLAAHGMSIAYTGRRPQQVACAFYPSLEELARASDFLVVACPGGPETRHLVDAEVLEALGPDGTLINIARGSVVDEASLIQALENGKLRAAGLDVFENEPQVPEALARHPAVALFPHVGSGTWETRQAMADLCVANLRAHFSGQPLLTPVV